MATRKPAASDKLLSRRVLINLQRDQTAATPTVVFQHEIPILEVLFGDGNAKLIEDPSVLDDGYSAKPSADMLVHNKRMDPIPRPSEAANLGWVFVGDPEAEYERLAACYGRHPEVNMTCVENVYGRFASGQFSRLLGRPELADLPDAQLRSLIASWGGEPDAIKAATTPEQLLELAEQVGVQIGG